MLEPVALKRLVYRLIFVGVAFFLVVQQLLPVNLAPGKWPEPDLLLLLALAWVLRRPNYIPLLLAAFIFLLNDFILFRPPGLWAACSVIGLEFLRGRKSTLQGQPFLFEWVLVSAVMALMVLFNRLILGLFLVPQQTLTADIVFLVGNMFLYPVVVALSVFILRVRASILGDDDIADQRP